MEVKLYFQNFIFQEPTCLDQTLEQSRNDWDFCTYRQDICCLKKKNTGTHSTEIHILKRDNNFKSFSKQIGTKLHETGDDFAFYIYGINLYVISKWGQSNSTEVHSIKL